MLGVRESVREFVNFLILELLTQLKMKFLIFSPIAASVGDIFCPISICLFQEVPIVN